MNIYFALKRVSLLAASALALSYQVANKLVKPHFCNPDIIVNKPCK